MSSSSSRSIGVSAGGAGGVGSMAGGGGMAMAVQAGVAPPIVCCANWVVTTTAKCAKDQSSGRKATAVLPSERVRRSVESSGRSCGGQRLPRNQSSLARWASAGRDADRARRTAPHAHRRRRQPNPRCRHCRRCLRNPRCRQNRKGLCHRSCRAPVVCKATRAVRRRADRTGNARGCRSSRNGKRVRAYSASVKPGSSAISRADSRDLHHPSDRLRTAHRS